MPNYFNSPTILGGYTVKFSITQISSFSNSFFSLGPEILVGVSFPDTGSYISSL
jgi:hypothetical protein